MALDFLKTKVYKNYMGDIDSDKQLIIADNGVFVKSSANSICFVTKKTTLKDYGYDSDDLVFDKVVDEPLTLEEKPYMIKKIPYGLIKTVLKFYQVYAKKGLEVKINIWYDKVNDEFFLDCPFQTVTATTAREYDFDSDKIIWTEELKNKYPDKYNLMLRASNYEIDRILETHSHHNMSCSFSSFDDKADYFDARGVSLSGVFITVMKNPRLHLRYFSSPQKKRVGQKSSLTRAIDEVLFREEDIFDFSILDTKEYDFNEFARHVNITDHEILVSGEDEV